MFIAGCVLSLTAGLAGGEWVWHCGAERVCCATAAAVGVCADVRICITARPRRVNEATAKCASDEQRVGVRRSAFSEERITLH
jgi:hypothetical protein